MNAFTEIRSGDAAHDTSRLRRLYGRYPTGVAAICALRDGEPVGIVATSFTPVSMEPALVSICVQHTSTTWPQLAREEHVGISVLAEGHAQLSRQLAAKNTDRFAGLTWFAGDTSAVFLADAAAWLDCRISTSIVAGDHDVVLMEVISAAEDETVSPLIFHDSRFRTMFTDDHRG
ncbi:flavin reductase family protein [Mycolicibacterium sp. 120266]|jgi:flavin reductase (DIM6/NTAB) family NADH-FMN oxidoreductase RutF|uniref:flavin reductase family protein n=1 Tax=Mycolicibacterium sp. 120266 TaxID=3090601 RepID=UPI00299F4575|nr:flavin reductase family protein [Mycolicibacterium sp. 120266]MDX1872989.1 flavin reductase family protein [Mycolicibacterium sp. 120266]